MYKLRNKGNLTILHAVLTLLAAVVIFVLSVTPAFKLGFEMPVRTGLSPQSFIYGALCFFIFIFLCVVGIRYLYTSVIRIKITVLHGVVTAAAALTILFFSVLPPLLLDSGVPVNSGACVHISAYAVLCFLTCMWLRVADITQFPLLCAFVFSSLYGILIECIQFGLPYRSFETDDILINCLAAALALLPSYAMIRYVPLYKKTNRVQEAISR